MEQSPTKLAERSKIVELNAEFEAVEDQRSVPEDSQDV